MDRDETIERLREIEARVAGAPGASDSQVIEAVSAYLARARAGERDAVTTFSVPDVVLIDLFFLLCDRYGIEGGVASKRSQKSLSVVAPRSFVDSIFAPVFRESSTVLFEHLIAEMHALIEETYRMKSDGPSVRIRRPSK